MNRAVLAHLLSRLAERVQVHVPDDGPFEPISETVPWSDARHPVAAVTLRVGPGQGAAIHKRYFDVRVSTDGGGSESSTWLSFQPKRELLQFLSTATTVDAVDHAVDAAIDELRRHALR